ncbi:glycosyltransferase family 87 protein [Solwaraspora sp. WMMD406]|uniref:glycosyltransferase family 87 protein n=1 Tax=Solwaraspora sp. WMMD406 TaxID=3016095 RepID=UPI002417041D|nr:glycosyltransferase family 87 protein [Solwaraspora sp. WMMD406]MDG4765715.1 glycosyltransferase family 87 protein [Solwaraspora sp. WMMD406]
MGFRRRSWAIGAVVGTWLASRTVLLLVATEVVPGLDVGGVFADVAFYRDWSGPLLRGQVPADDPMWQYPPGAAVLFTAVRLLAGKTVTAYTAVFVLFAMAADLVILGALLRLARGGGRLLGVWCWVLAVPLLNLLTYGRYDIFVTAVAVVALAATVRRPGLAGALVAVGTLAKVWPALLLITARPVRGLRPMLVGFVAALVGLGTVLTVLYADAWSGFSGNQVDRGLQVESVGATPLMVARLWDPTITVDYVYGAMELDAAAVGAVTVVLPVATLAGLAGLGLWWLTRGRWIDWTATVGFDLALLAVLVAVVTSRVFSPQYLLWLIALAAVCLTRRDTTQRVPCALIVLATALTAAYFPWFYGDVIAEPAWPGTILLAVRNAVVVAATGIGLRRLLRRHVESGTDGGPGRDQVTLRKPDPAIRLG